MAHFFPLIQAFEKSGVSSIETPELFNHARTD
jgi:hypothetical protein